MAEERFRILWDVTAALMLTISLTMLADFAHRLLSADPDTLGIGAISVQAALALAASATFTDSGWDWLRKQRQDNARRSFGLTVIAFVLVAIIWKFVPTQLAQYYYNRGIELESRKSPQNADPSGAMRNYQRAIALDPVKEPVYVNLGEVLEEFYRYDEAANQYRAAIVADRTDAIPYNNLARILLLQGNAVSALRIAEDGLQENPDADTASALLKNKAWAEYQLGFYSQAAGDAKNLKTAAGDCILGKAYTRLGRKAEEHEAWKKFRQEYKAEPTTASAVQPDCQLLAEEIDETK